MNRGRIISAVYLVISAMVLMAAAWINHYPLVYSDTGTYVSSGFSLETPWDRPIVYGIFIRIFSLNGLSLWTVAFAQSFILVWLMNLCFISFTPAKNAPRATLISSAILAVFTGLSWVSSFLIADIFTPVSILALMLILFSEKISRTQIILLYITALLALGMHISHIGLAVLLLGFLLMRHWIAKKFRRESRLKTSRILYIILVSGLAYLSMGSAVGKARHIFMMARLSEMGVLKSYLDDNCGKQNFDLCRFRDSLPSNSGVFLWEPHSPLHRMGGRQAVAKEYNFIIGEIFTTPRYLTQYARSCFTGTYQQCLAFNPGEGIFAYPDSSTVNKAIATYFPHEKRMYDASLQQNQQVADISPYNYISQPAIILAILLVFAWLIMAKGRSGIFTDLFLFITAAILLQHFFCAATATIAQRYGCRVIWLFTFFLIMLFVSGEMKKITAGKNTRGL